MKINGDSKANKLDVLTYDAIGFDVEGWLVKYKEKCLSEIVQASYAKELQSKF
jgi:hypothetical protein